jgi:hypothetical protein
VSRAATIVGPRQAGKSTLAKQLQAAGVVPNYFSLDDDALRAAAQADPDGFALSLASGGDRRDPAGTGADACSARWLALAPARRLEVAPPRVGCCWC